MVVIEVEARAEAAELVQLQIQVLDQVEVPKEAQQQKNAKKQQQMAAHPLMPVAELQKKVVVLLLLTAALSSLMMRAMTHGNKKSMVKLKRAPLIKRKRPLMKPQLMKPKLMAELQLIVHLAEPLVKLPLKTVINLSTSLKKSVLSPHLSQSLHQSQSLRFQAEVLKNAKKK